MPCIVIVGGFYGDEGKGKVIAYLAKKDNYSIAVRGGVGPNAGHTFVDEGKMYKVRMLPSAALNRSTRLLIGPGVLINPEILLKEIETFNASDRTFVDTQCGIIDQKHIEKDNLEDHLKGFIGTTGSGTGPANADRAFRLLKLAREIDVLSLYLEDVSSSVNFALDNKENVIAEGTQGTFLSLYYGEYPYVTSKDVTASGICSDVGIGPKKVDDVLVVFKSYVTRVGGGPLQDEVSREEAEKRGWLEYGSVTGRERRSSPFDMNLAKKAIRLNSATQLAITKLDVIFPETSGIREFNKLSEKAKKFIQNIEAETGVKVILIGTGAELNDIIDRRI
ncbi:MAG TPA: adenylosuccinate synthetase [Nitrososphaeraceae archaeon]|jgi:adenylosuccinate synthase|nr:adenylosuccinate synthetase [Nitrososphaeraceae archaeon]